MTSGIPASTPTSADSRFPDPGPIIKAPDHASFLGRIAWLLTVVLAVPLTIWAAAALYYDVRVPWLRAPLTGLFLACVIAGWRFSKARWGKPLVMLMAFVVVLTWWLSLKPSNDRDWQADVAVLPYADVEGSRVTIHNIRNCVYRSEFDYDVRHYDQSFDLDLLRSVDLYMVWWGSPYMAHTMVSYGFEGGAHLCFSIETRKEKGEGYSAIKGLFRQFELIYVVADERDLVQLRTNYRQGEEVYLFPLRATPEQARRSLLEYLGRINSLRQQPEWYSAVTQNCTTSIRAQRAADTRSVWDWRMLINGFGDTLLYERGLIATNLPLAELKERCHINARARKALETEDFSRLIRDGVPESSL